MANKRLLSLCAVGVAVAAALYWGLKPEATQQRLAPATTSVQAEAAKLADVAVKITALGTVQANQSVNITSQVSGRLTAIHFTEGAWVEKGTLLATIDSRNYEAQLAQHAGQLAQNKAQLANAKLVLSRYEKLIKQDSVSRQELDTQRALVKQYEGAVRATEGLIAADRVNLDHCQIKAPISGYLGIKNVDVGNLVSANNSATPIVTLTETDPITVLFSVAQTHAPQIVTSLRSGSSLPVEVYEQKTQKLLAQGQVAAIDNTIDPDTGTVKLKAVFDNKQSLLFPNQSVNVKVQTSVIRNATVIPAAAVLAGTAGLHVFKVDEKNIVHKTLVTTGDAADGNYLIAKSGVKAGDKLVTVGVNYVSSGSRVNVVTPQKADLSVLDKPKTRTPRARGQRAGMGSGQGGQKKQKPEAAQAPATPAVK